MAEYIDRDTVINKRRRMSEYDEAGWCVTCQAVSVEDIENTPSAEVVEVVHGEWFLLDECLNEGVYCSVCSKKVYRKEYANQKIKSKYCPNCGAKMDGERRSENES